MPDVLIMDETHVTRETLAPLPRREGLAPWGHNPFTIPRGSPPLACSSDASSSY